jgi:hypothetical protein
LISWGTAQITMRIVAVWRFNCSLVSVPNPQAGLETAAHPNSNFANTKLLKLRIHNRKTRTLYQCNRCSRTGQPKYFDSRSPGHTVGISTRRLKARHLHSLIAIFCPRQHYFRPITLVASSDDSFGIALAVSCSCEVDRCRVIRSSVHRNFGDHQFDSEKAEWVVIWPRKR